MPELPEVETLRLQLSRLIVGQTIKKIKIFKVKSFIGDPKLIVGAKLTGVSRIAKILVFEFDNRLALAIHLKLTGQLIFRNESIESKIEKGEIIISDPLLKQLPNKHTRVIITFFSGDRVYFNDLRIFGWMRIINQISNLKTQNHISKIKNISDIIGKFGPEPFKDLTLEKFKKILGSCRKPIKLALMDQEKIAGVGNIYANDALFLAKINPKTPSDSLTSDQVETLYLKLIKLLGDAIKWGGASEDNFRDAYGQMGHAHEHFCVYDKKGQNCPNKCGEKIKRITLGGRGTFFCSKCQK